LRLYFVAKNGDASRDFDVALYDRNDHAHNTRGRNHKLRGGGHHENWVDVAGRALATRGACDR